MEIKLYWNLQQHHWEQNWIQSRVFFQLLLVFLFFFFFLFFTSCNLIWALVSYEIFCLFGLDYSSVIIGKGMKAMWIPNKVLQVNGPRQLLELHHGKTGVCISGSNLLMSHWLLNVFLKRRYLSIETTQPAPYFSRNHCCWSSVLEYSKNLVNVLEKVHRLGDYYITFHKT